MAETIHYENGCAHFHDVKETMAAWDDTTGQGNERARARGRDCVVVRANLAEALLLSMAFHHYFAIESCCHYDRESNVLSMYCGDASRGCPALMARMQAIATGLGVPILDPDNHNNARSGKKAGESCS